VRILFWQYPPNFDQICEAFDPPEGVVITYGADVFVPHAGTLPSQLKDHEAVHVERQLAYPGGPSAWWSRYIEDEGFRFMEELPAHQAEFHAYQYDSRQTRRHALKAIAKRLSGPLYGRLCTIEKAKSLVQNKEGHDYG